VSAEIAVPGLYHLQLVTAHLSARTVWVTPNGGVMHAEGDVTIGETAAHEVAHLKSDDEAWWDGLAVYAAKQAEAIRQDRRDRASLGGAA
jgi:hypothetical protein